MVWLDIDVEVVLSEVVMAAHQHKCIVGIPTARKFGEIVVCYVGLALGGREHRIVILHFTSVALLFKSFLRCLFLDQEMP